MSRILSLCLNIVKDCPTYSYSYEILFEDYVAFRSDEQFSY